MRTRAPMPTVPTTADVVKRQILSRVGRQWKPGDRLPPLAQLSRQLSVGQRSTYQALRELCEAGVLVARQGRGTFVSPTLSPQQLMRTAPGLSDAGAPPGPLHGRSVRILTADAYADAIIQEMAAAAGQTLRDSGATVTQGRHPAGNDLSSLADSGDHALVLINPSTSMPIRFDARQMLAVVSTTQHLIVAAGEGFDLVTPNEEQGSFLAGRRLRELGCTRPAFVGAADPADSAVYDGTSRTRLHGFEAGFGQVLPPSRRLRVRRYGLTSGAAAVLDFQCLTHRPDGIFAASDELAAGFIAGAIALGLRHGHDYQIIGFDGQRRYRQVDDGELASVVVPAAELGRQAAGLLIERLEHPGTPARRLSIGCSLPPAAAQSVSGLADSQVTS